MSINKRKYLSDILKNINFLFIFYLKLLFLINKNNINWTNDEKINANMLLLLLLSTSSGLIRVDRTDFSSRMITIASYWVWKNVGIHTLIALDDIRAYAQR
jgi:hypothetical protein